MLGGVYANGIAWFVEPDDSDTAIAFRQTAPTVDHAVDAGAVSFAFHLPEPTVTHTVAPPPPSLVLSDFILPAGRVQVFAALIEVEVSGELIYRDSDVGSLIDGDLELASDITINRFRVRSGPLVRFNRSGAGNVSTYLGNNEDGTFHFQDSGGVDTQDVSAILTADRFTGGANFRDADVVSRVDDLV